MKKYIYLSAFALVGLLSACNDDYVDKFDIDYEPTDVKNINYTLTATDYASIASNSTNQELALAKDPEGRTGVIALNAVGTNKYFTDAAPADEYIPALLASKYPNADLGSKFNITYNNFVSPSAYLAELNDIKSYTLTSENYDEVWGSTVKAYYLSPNSISKLPEILSSSVEDAEAGDLYVVNYAYSTTEPSIGGGGGQDVEPTWQQVQPLARALGASFNYVNVGPIDLSEFKGQTVNIGIRYTSTTSAAATYEFQNFKAGSVPYTNVLLYAEQEDGTFKKIQRKSEFKGEGKYVIAALWSDGKVYPFGRIAGDKGYGYVTPAPIAEENGVIAAADAADHVVTLAAGTTEGTFTIQNAIGKYFYNSANSSGSYYNSFNVSDEIGESGYEWTIENVNSSNDQFIITNTLSANLIHCTIYKGTIEFGNWPVSKTAGNEYVSNTLINDEGGFSVYDIDLGGMTTALWNNNNYGWVATAYISSTKERFATESYLVSPAFDIAEDAIAPYFTLDETFRFDGAEAITYWVSTDYNTVGAGTRAETQVASTDAVLYQFDGEHWKEYKNSDANIAVFGPAEYEALGSTTVSNPDYVMPVYLSKVYPYAEVGTKAAVIYNTSKGIVAKEFSLNELKEWIATPTYTTETTTFSVDADGISANLSVYIDDTLTDGSDGGFTAQNVKLGDGMTFVWRTDAIYGWRASGYANKTNNETEAWIVSPSMNFKKAVQPLLSFDEAYNYLNGASPTNYFGILISTDYNGDVTTCTWSDLTSSVQAWSNGSWDYVNSGQIDLTPYIGGRAVIAFRYRSDASAAATWEVKNVKVVEASYVGN